MCPNVRTQWVYILGEEATSPTLASEAIIITGVIDVKHKRDVMTLDTPDSLVQTESTLVGEYIIMNIRGEFVYFLF